MRAVGEAAVRFSGEATRRWTAAVLGAAVLVAADPAPGHGQDDGGCPEDLSSLAWMAGEWRGAEGEVEMIEVWLPPAGGVMLGVHRDVFGPQRSFFEFLRIAPGEDRVPVYHASPAGRPATPFRAVECGPSRAVFENPSHDFPQRIVYERDGETMVARIEGTEEGVEKSSEWVYESARQAGRRALLAFQETERLAHLEKDPDLLVSLFADDFLSVAGGRATRSSRDEQRARFAGYLESVDLLEWDDVEPPVLRVSDDGSMAWALVQKRVRLVPVDEPDAEPEHTVFAWLETWEKRAGEWRLTSVTTTHRTGED